MFVCTSLTNAEISQVPANKRGTSSHLHLYCSSMKHPVRLRTLAFMEMLLLALYRESNLGCVIVILYSGKKEYGHRRQKLFMDFGVWPETAIHLSHRIPSPYVWKPRWLLWLEDTSTDESRRAAAALR
jgi:hypothetical protein